MAAEEEEKCPICFEGVVQPVELPCPCTVSYCAKCWDCSLAKSFNSTGRARCPTCRGPVRVDFDAERCILNFSAEPTELENLREYVTETTKRLLAQARPKQVRQLQKFAEERPELAQLVGGSQAPLEGMSPRTLRSHLARFVGEEEAAAKASEAAAAGNSASLLTGLVDAAGNAAVLASFWASEGHPGALQPTCICGVEMRRCTLKERAAEFIVKETPLRPDDLRFETFLEDILRRGLKCDICNEHMKDTGVWTCDQGHNTMLHATSYDVCDLCFGRCIS